MKKVWSNIDRHLDESQRHYAEPKKPVSIPFMTFLEDKSMGMKKTGVVARDDG